MPLLSEGRYYTADGCGKVEFHRAHFPLALSGTEPTSSQPGFSPDSDVQQGSCIRIARYLVALLQQPLPHTVFRWANTSSSSLHALEHDRTGGQLFAGDAARQAGQA